MPGPSWFQKNPVSGLAKRSINSTLLEVWMVEMAKLADDQYAVFRHNQETFWDRDRLLLDDVGFFNRNRIVKELHGDRRPAWVIGRERWVLYQR